MDIAALIAWVLTALGGFFLLGTWVQRGGLRQQQTGGTRFPAPVIFGHFALAAIGLVVWIIYVVADTSGLAWTAFVLLLPVAALGFVMFLRWLPVHQGRTLVGAGAVAGTAAPGQRAADTAPAEKHFPLPVVLGHGLLAVTTLVLVLLTALGVGD